MNRDRLLQRFLRYVQIDSTARPEAEVYPSSPGQIEVGRLLLGELQALGLADARQNEHGIVMATVPGRSGKGDSPHLCEAPSGPLRQMGAVPLSAPGNGRHHDAKFVLPSVGQSQALQLAQQ